LIIDYKIMNEEQDRDILLEIADRVLEKLLNNELEELTSPTLKRPINK